MDINQICTFGQRLGCHADEVRVQIRPETAMGALDGKLFQSFSTERMGWDVLYMDLKPWLLSAPMRASRKGFKAVFCVRLTLKFTISWSLPQFPTVKAEADETVKAKNPGISIRTFIERTDEPEDLRKLRVLSTR